MSDYHYAVVHENPPRPKMTIRLWLHSWCQPVRGWTIGKAVSLVGEARGVADCRAQWIAHRGRVRLVSRNGLIHTCAEGGSCRCLTGRRFKPEQIR